MNLTLDIAEMVFKLKLIHCYIFKNSYINIFHSFRGTLGHLYRIIGTLLCYHGIGLMLIYKAILCLNTDEKVFILMFRHQCCVLKEFLKFYNI